MTLLEAHDIETEVIESIRSLPQVDDVFVHVDPKELGEWKEDETTDLLSREFGGEGETESGLGASGATSSASTTPNGDTSGQ
jgi:hypothetical protein